LEPFKNLAATLKKRQRHVGQPQQRLCGGHEWLLQQVKRAARGFKTATNFIMIAYSRTSKL
jgi:hypothetical protein